MSDIQIADFDPADIDALVLMWRASFEFSLGIVDWHPIDEQIAYLRDQLVPTHRLRVARRESQIVGFVASTSESVAQLYVRVEDIGQGIGTRLLDTAKAESEGSLWLFTHPQNSRACRFYERHGFVVVGHGFDSAWRLPDVKYQWFRAKDRD